jgi:hypothetical protein
MSAKKQSCWHMMTSSVRGSPQKTELRFDGEAGNTVLRGVCGGLNLGCPWVPKSLKVKPLM